LLQAAREVLIPDSTEYIKIVDSIENDHIAVVQEAISDFQLQQETIFDVKTECTKLRSFMQAAEVN
jgi:aspartate kinase